MAEKAEEEPSKFDVVFGELLTVVDRDYNEFISFTELERAFPGAASAFFSDVDLNEDNKVSVEEFRKVFILADESEDTDRVAKLTVELKDKLEEEFYTAFWKLVAFLDRNYDDNISLSEFTAMYPEATKSFFNDLDTDENDQLNAEEFKQMFVLADGTFDVNRVRDISSSVRKNMMEAFNAEFKVLLVLVDKNEDNKISLSEFSEMYPGASKGMFDSLDLNHNQELSIGEFKKLFLLADGTYDTARVKETCNNMEVENKECFQEQFEALLRMLDQDFDTPFSMDAFKKVYPDAAKMFFGWIDENEDKQLSPEELTEFFTVDGRLDTPRVRSLKKQLKEAMKKEFESTLDAFIALIDKNADDVVSLTEFAAAYPTMTKTFFGALDTNQDNALQRKEIREMFVLADGTCDTARCKEMMQEVIGGNQNQQKA